MRPPSIADAAALTRKLDARGVIVLVFDRGRGAWAGASYGQTRPECRDLGLLLDAIGDRLDRGELRAWSEGSAPSVAPAVPPEPQADLFGGKPRP